MTSILAMADVQSTSRLKFDHLTKGKKGVVIDPTYMAAITEGTGFYQARDCIADIIQAVFEDLNQQTNREVSSYCIGLASLPSILNPSEPHTFTAFVHLLYQEWDCLRRSGCGQDGLITVAAVTEKALPKKHDGSGEIVNVRDYSVALCQQLLHLFKIVNKDTRLLNKDFTVQDATWEESMKSTPTHTCTSIIYIAVTLK